MLALILPWNQFNNIYCSNSINNGNSDKNYGGDNDSDNNGNNQGISRAKLIYT